MYYYYYIYVRNQFATRAQKILELSRALSKSGPSTSSDDHSAHGSLRSGPSTRAQSNGPSNTSEDPSALCHITSSPRVIRNLLHTFENDNATIDTNESNDTIIDTNDHAYFRSKIGRVQRVAAGRAALSLIVESDNSDLDSRDDPEYRPLDADNILDNDVVVAGDVGYDHGDEHYINVEVEEIEAGDWMNLNEHSDVNQSTVLEIVAVANEPESVTEHPNTLNEAPTVSLLKTKCRTREKQSARNMEKYVLLPPCSESCRRKCRATFNEEYREEIRSYFWPKPFGERKMWLNSHVTFMGTKQKARNPRQYSKNISVRYSLNHPTTGEKVQVCKKMFLSTMGLKTDGQISGLKRKTAPDGRTNTNDKRGQYERKKANNVREELVRHIESYKPQLSHYALENAPKRRYLDVNITIIDMLKDFNVKHEQKVSYELYRKVFDTQNIGYSRPSQDECPTCIKADGHEHDSLAADNACKACIDISRHKTIAQEAREDYQRDATKKWETYEEVFAVDMQKVIMLPKMNVKEHFFISRLTVFNETFASLAGGEDICILWHEGIAGRDASDVMSAYYRAIQRASHANSFLFWVDNCSAQNKNWTLFSGLVSLVNCDYGPELITIKYFEPGHTYMRADSVHGCIGKAMKKEEQILNWEDFTTLVNNASKTTVAVEMVNSYVIPDYHRQATRKLPLPLLKDVRVVQFKKGFTALKYKERNREDEEFQSVEFMKQKIRRQTNALWTGEIKKPRGMQVEKKRVIVEKLLPLMPPRKREFWSTMATSEESVDLTSDRDPQELLAAV